MRKDYESCPVSFYKHCDFKGNRVSAANRRETSTKLQDIRSMTRLSSHPPCNCSSFNTARTAAPRNRKKPKVGFIQTLFSTFYIQQACNLSFPFSFLFLPSCYNVWWSHFLSLTSSVLLKCVAASSYGLCVGYIWIS